MIYVIIILSAFLFSGLTFFSGFGLATVLTPVFILFFPVPIAISLTAIIHFLNNLFKLFLVGKHGNLEVLLKFGVPAMLGALAGGLTLLAMIQKSFVIKYELFNHNFYVGVVNFTIGLLIFLFALIETLPKTNIYFNKNMLPLGGILSGFFGGLSGHQGAFRSIFLLKCNLSKEQFIATGILIACMVDIVRLPIYRTIFVTAKIGNEIPLLTFTIFSAFLGSYLASKYMKKVTINFIRIIITLLLVAISIGLITGLI